MPKGDPCTACGLPANRHRVKHKPSHDDHCDCGVPITNHGRRTRSDRERENIRERRRNNPPDDYFVGIDGEGQGRRDHRYVLLAWSNAEGNLKEHIEAKPGQRLTTEECLDFLLDMPSRAKAFAFAFNYDLTKILQDVDNKALWYLFRPELRARKPGYEKFGPRPVPWKNFSLNLIGSKFTVKKGKKIRVIWDIFKFFQSKFTTALVDWKVGEKERLERMRVMKDQRDNFDKLDPVAVRDYCYDECRDMAALAQKLTDAHIEAGLPLKTYFGAGSSASAMLKVMGIGEQFRETPAKLRDAVARAFFGGRFENGVVGAVAGPVWSYDISSAYPYQLFRMPCLGCGKWRKARKRSDLEGATTALVRYRLGPAPAGQHWGPFPFRLKTGAIAFPAESGGGWVYLEEYLAGERLFPNVKFAEAWIYKTKCKHQPFAQMPAFYLERLKLGKEGPGLVIKLGSNSCFGKTAQAVGTNPPFKCEIWAGMITSGTRAQMLDMMALHKDLNNLLMIATDGMYTRERLTPPVPEDTGTFKAINEKGELAGKPLGGWEEKLVDKGVFAARPGIYFPMDPTAEELKQVRARGVGRGVMFESWRLAVDAWKRKEMTVSLPNVTRFCGAKSSIFRSLDEKTKKYVYTRNYLLEDGKRSDRIAYGQWHTRKIVMSFNPEPKRKRIRPDNTLEIHRFPPEMVSAAYDRMVLSDDARQLKLDTLIALEQPTGDDFAEYDLDDTSL